MGPAKTSQDQSCSSGSDMGRETCVFVVPNLEEEGFEIHMSILRSSKRTLFSASQGIREGREAELLQL